ncbi:MAG: dTMP kinase [Spirochaetales bacterium]|nr:dTMP kinase [Spirochaetales bacterium]
MQMLIAIDGIDGVGKGTQSKLLYNSLKDRGFKSALISFPQYNSFFGKMVGEYLNGNYGGINDIDPKLTSLLYALDRKLYFENNNIADLDIIISDRYVPSNLSHQGVKVKKNHEGFFTWIESLEYEINKIPKPDIVFILDASVEKAIYNVSQKKKREYTELSHDIHESDYHYLDKVRKLFIELTKRDNYFLINCEQDNEMLPIDKIFQSIINIVNEYIDE